MTCEHKYQHATGVYSHSMPSKKSRRGENIRVCMCKACQKKDLDDRIQNKCPSCGQWIKVKSIINDRLIGEICPVCDERQKNGRYFKYFTGVDCPLCKQTEGIVKSLKDKGFVVEEYSNDNPDGLAEISYHAILSVPTLMLFEDEDKKTAEWIGEIRKADVMAEL